MKYLGSRNTWEVRLCRVNCCMHAAPSMNDLMPSTHWHNEPVLRAQRSNEIFDEMQRNNQIAQERIVLECDWHYE